MLTDLPASLLSLVMKAVHDDGPFNPGGGGYVADPKPQRGLQAINLTCRATHNALPDAFLGEEDTNHDDDFAAPNSAMFDTEVSRVWQRHACPDRPLSQLVLRMDLDDLSRDLAPPPLSPTRSTPPCNPLPTPPAPTPAAMQPLPEALAAALAHFGRRWARVPFLQLRLRNATSEAGGAALFAHHVAPHLLAVRHLFIFGPTNAAIPSMWDLPGFVALAAGVRELSVCGHHSGVVPLAARLAAVFPTATAVQFTVVTHHSEVDEDGARCNAVAVRVPAGLVTLMVSAEEDVEDPMEDESHPETPLVLTLTGHPGQLHTLKLHTWYLDSDWRCDGNPARHVDIASAPLPALRCLDVTFDPTCHGEHGCGPLLPRLPALCPALSKLVLCGWNCQSLADVEWGAVVEELAPLAGSLERLQLDHGEYAGEDGEMLAKTLKQLGDKLLPRMRLRIRYWGGGDSCVSENGSPTSSEGGAGGAEQGSEAEAEESEAEVEAEESGSDAELVEDKSGSEGEAGDEGSGSEAESDEEGSGSEVD